MIEWWWGMLGSWSGTPRSWWGTTMMSKKIKGWQAHPFVLYPWHISKSKPRNQNLKIIKG
jgi:hypothetical protein